VFNDGPLLLLEMALAMKCGERDGLRRSDYSRDFVTELLCVSTTG
jgi:hypothetical protein